MSLEVRIQKRLGDFSLNVDLQTDGGVLGISVSAKGAKAIVSISNGGATISPEELPLVFDRFHKTDHSRSKDRDGVGLGLYLVKSIINSHDEDIAVKSEDGMTEFVFTLPLAE